MLFSIFVCVCVLVIWGWIWNQDFQSLRCTTQRQKPIACLSDVKPEEGVLARWCDNKLYNATENYISKAEKGMDASTAVHLSTAKTSIWPPLCHPASRYPSQHHSSPNELPTPPSPSQPQYNSTPARWEENDTLSVIGGDQRITFQRLLESIEQLGPEVGVRSAKTEAAKQELYPESGLFLSSTR